MSDYQADSYKSQFEALFEQGIARATDTEGEVDYSWLGAYHAALIDTRPLFDKMHDAFKSYAEGKDE